MPLGFSEIKARLTGADCDTSPDIVFGPCAAIGDERIRWLDFTEENFTREIMEQPATLWTEPQKQKLLTKLKQWKVRAALEMARGTYGNPHGDLASPFQMTIDGEEVTFTNPLWKTSRASVLYGDGGFIAKISNDTESARKGCRNENNVVQILRQSIASSPEFMSNFPRPVAFSGGNSCYENYINNRWYSAAEIRTAMKGSVDLKTAAWLTVAIAKLMMKVHQQCYVHRAIRPEAVIVSLERKIIELHGWEYAGTFSGTVPSYPDNDLNASDVKAFMAGDAIGIRATPPSVDVYSLTMFFWHMVGGTVSADSWLCSAVPNVCPESLPTNHPLTRYLRCCWLGPSARIPRMDLFLNEFSLLLRQLFAISIT